MTNEITFTEINTAEDLEAVFAAAAARTIEFDNLPAARDYIYDNGLPMAAYRTLKRNANGKPILCSVTLP